MTKRRVVVTGFGIVSPHGLDVEKAWQSVISGNSAVCSIDRFDTTQVRSKVAASLKDYRSELYFDAKEIKRMDRFIEYGLIAADNAYQNADLDRDSLDLERAGVCIGSGIGGLQTIEETSIHSHTKLHRISPFFIPSSIINMVSGMASMRLGFLGPNFSVATACATGSHCIGLSARSIAYGDADIMIAGGTESPITPISIGGFSSLRALTTKNDEPEKASRPFDRDRDGFVIAEGSAVLVLESLEHAKARGADIKAEIVGFGMSSDAHHITMPDPSGRGAHLAMTSAMKDANISSPDDVDYINAHGTSTPKGDEIEPMVVKKIFGERPRVAMSSTKSMHGHLLGAAGSLESVWCCLAIRDQVIPPTINLDQPDTICDHINMVPHTYQEQKVKTVINNSFGFGGTNVSLIFKAYD